ncbi:MAG TPA: hypothetical protein VEK35_10045 [Roseiarcus sp.]|nr:hypothetical protein [Roseiarcus sp.]
MSAARTRSRRRATAAKKTVGATPVERLEATPERILRAAERGEGIACGPESRRRVEEPFDVMRANRALAPHDRKLNDLRWLIGEALRRLHHRAALDNLRAVSTERLGAGVVGPRSGLPLSEAALHARDKLRRAEQLVGPAAWPVLRRIVIEGARLRDCRHLIVEVATAWRADAILADRLRCGLDSLGVHLGVAAPDRRATYS